MDIMRSIVWQVSVRVISEQAQVSRTSSKRISTLNREMSWTTSTRLSRHSGCRRDRKRRRAVDAAAFLSETACADDMMSETTNSSSEDGESCEKDELRGVAAVRPTKMLKLSWTTCLVCTGDGAHRKKEKLRAFGPQSWRTNSTRPQKSL